MHQKIKILMTVFATILLGGCVAYVDESTLIKPIKTPHIDVASFNDPNLTPKTFDIQMKDGNKIKALYFEHKKPKALVFYLGGNQFTIYSNHRKILNIYKDMPVNLLLIDYRGYGQSAGVASLNDLLKDTESIYLHAEQLSSQKHIPIFVHGHSLGSFLASDLAKNHSPEVLILESSATTSEDWINGFVNSNIFVRRGVVTGSLQGKGSLSTIKSFRKTLVLLVGEHDKITPPDLSKKLYSASPLPESRKHLIISPNSGHDNAADSSLYADLINKLLLDIKTESPSSPVQDES